MGKCVGTACSFRKALPSGLAKAVSNKLYKGKILVKVPFSLSAPVISDRGLFDSFVRIPTQMFALNGRLPTLHLPHHGDCRISRSLSRSVNRHCRRPRTRVLQCSAESALTAEDFERRMKKILKPIQDDLRAVKVRQIICFC